jgi:DNA-binding FadR family transcriptional regulator
MQNKEIKLQKGYELVRDYLQNQIRNGTYAPGEKLPSVVDLSIQYRVGRSTVREALSALKAMGWLDIRQGGGTFVRNNISNLDEPWAIKIYVQNFFKCIFPAIKYKNRGLYIQYIERTILY